MQASDAVLQVSYAPKAANFNSFVVIYYASGDCTGTGYVFPAAYVGTVTDIQPDGSLQYVAPSAATQNVDNINSQGFHFAGSGQPDSCCGTGNGCWSSPQTLDGVVPLSAAQTFNPGVTFPVHLEIRGQ